jgi:hypothetical protein
MKIPDTGYLGSVFSGITGLTTCSTTLLLMQLVNLAGISKTGKTEPILVHIIADKHKGKRFYVLLLESFAFLPRYLSIR